MHLPLEGDYDIPPDSQIVRGFSKVKFKVIFQGHGQRQGQGHLQGQGLGEGHVQGHGECLCVWLYLPLAKPEDCLLTAPLALSTGLIRKY